MRTDDKVHELTSARRNHSAEKIKEKYGERHLLKRQSTLQAPWKEIQPWKPQQQCV